MTVPIPTREVARRQGWRPESFGRSHDGIPLVAWWPSGTADRILVGAVHGEESATLQLLHQLLRTTPADTASAVVVPVLNPDGVLAGTRQNARGVDLNRNFPSTAWCAGVTPTYPPTTLPDERISDRRTQLSSSGSAGGSEPETQALIELFRQVRPRLVIDLHAPLECVIARGEAAVGVAGQIAAPAGLPVLRQLEEPTPGDLGLWADEQGSCALTYEIEAAPFHALWQRHEEGLRVALTVRPPS